MDCFVAYAPRNDAYYWDAYYWDAYYWQQHYDGFTANKARCWR